MGMRGQECCISGESACRAIAPAARYRKRFGAMRKAQGGDEFTVIVGELCDAGSVERSVLGILQTLAEPFQLGTASMQQAA